MNKLIFSKRKKANKLYIFFLQAVKYLISKTLHNTELNQI
jgi:hypothetical protein